MGLFCLVFVFQGYRLKNVFGFFPMMFVFLFFCGAIACFGFQLNSPSDIDGCVCVVACWGWCFCISVTVSLDLHSR